MELKKNAVDLTDLAIGILVLGIVVTIGATILLNIRDSSLTDLSVDTTVNESTVFTGAETSAFANTWVSSTEAVCINNSNAAVVPSTNYSITVSPSTGVGTISNATADQPAYPSPWNCTYTTYDTTRADWALPDAAATGIAEYGNWFDIIVIVGVAAVILSLIFMAFGRAGSGTQQTQY